MRVSMSLPSSLFLPLAIALGSSTAHATQAPGAVSADRATATRAAGALPAGPGAALGWQWELGGALIANPRFQGADEYRLLPVPYVDARYLDRKGVRLFANVPQGLGGYVYRHRGEQGQRFDVGLALAPGFANRDQEDVPGLPDFGPAVEARAYLQYGSGSWGVSASLAQAVGTGHEGAYGDISASYRRRLGQGFVAVGPVLRVGDGTYLDALYSVPTEFSGTSGLPAYEAGAGIESLSVQGLYSGRLTGAWRLTGILRAGRLLGDAADSPIVQSETQFFGLIAVTRQF